MRRFAVILLTVALLMGMPTSSIAQNDMVTKKEASAAAQHYIKIAVEYFNAKWNGAVTGAPILFYDTEGNPESYFVPVQLKSDRIGYVMVSAFRAGEPILEASEQPLKVEDLTDIARAVADTLKAGQSIGKTRLIHAGPLYLAVQFELLGPRAEKELVYYNLKAKKLMPRDTTVPKLDVKAHGSSESSKHWDSILNPPQISIMAVNTGSVLGVPSYDQNLSSHPNSGCGPAAGAMVLGYWKQHGYPALQFDMDVSEGIDLMNDLYTDMGSTAVGTTIAGWTDGVRYHANTKHYSDGNGLLYNTGYSFTASYTNTLAGTYMPWEVLKTEISASRPVGFYIGWDNGLVPGLTYNYHWVAGRSFYEDTNTGERLLVINNSWGSSDSINYTAYAAGKDVLATVAVRP